MKTKEQPKFWLLGMFLFASLGFFLLANNAYAEDTDLSTINDEFRFDYGVHYYRFEETGTARNDENFAGEGADIKMTPIPGGYHWVVTFNKGAKDLADGGESPNNSDPKKNFRYNNPRYAIGIPKGLQRPTSMTFTVYDDKGQLVHEPETVQNTQTPSGYVDGLEKTYIDDHNWLDDQRFIDRQSYTSEPFDEYADWFFRGKGDQSIDTLSAGLDRPLKDEKGIEVDKSISRDLDVIYTFRGADEGNRLGAWGYAATYVVEFDTKFKFDATTGYSDAKMELLAAMRNRESDPAMNIYIKMAKYSIYNTVWYCYNYDLEIMPVNSHFSEEDFDNSWIPQPGVSGTKDTIKWIMLLGYPYDVRNSKYLDYYILRYDRDPAYARYSYADKYQFAANSFYYATQQAIWHFTNGKEYPKNSVAREIGELAEKLANDKVPFPDTIKSLYLDNNGAINRGKLVQNFVSLRSKNLSRENAKLSIQLEKVSGEGSPIKDNPATFDLYKGAYHQGVPSDVDPVQTDIQTDGIGLTAVLNDLESDTAYTLVEKSAPTGYSVSAPLVFKLASIYKSNRYNYFWEGFNAPYGFLRPYLDYAERAGYRLEIHQKVSKDELSSNESAAGEVYEWSPAKVSVKSPESPIYKTQNEFMETDQTRMRIANFKAEAVSLGDFVWLDKNNNGIQDNGEQPVKDAKVVLYRFGQPVKVKDVQFANQGVIVSKADSTGVLKEEKLTDPESVVQTTTDKNGHYFFKNVNAGEYSVKFIAPDGSYAFTKVNTGKNDRLDSDANPQTGVSFAAGVFANTKLQDTNNPFKLNNPNIDAGFVKSVSIGDFAWIDANENGRQDNDEKPLSNVRVYLQVEKEVLINSDGATKTEYEDASYSDVVALNGSGQQAVGYSGELLSSDAFGAVYTITDENGHYAFRNILPGNYKVRFELPSSAYKYTKDKTTANVNDTLRDSDALESNIVQGKSMSRTTDIYHLDADKPVKDERDSLHLTDPSADMGVVEIGASFGDLVWFDGSYFDASAYGQERFDPTGRKVVVGDSKFDLTTEANIRKSRKNTEMTFDDRGLSYVKVQLLDEKGQPAKVKDVALNGQSIKINMDLSKAETTNKNGQKVPGGNLAQDLTDKELKADGDQLAYTYTSALELSGSTYAWTGEKNEREAFGRYFFKGLKPGKYKARFIIYRADMKLEDSGKEGAISNPFNKFIDSSATDAKLFPYSQQNRIRFVQKAPEDQIGADGEYNRASQVNTVEGAFVGETDVFDLSNVTKSYKVYQDKVSNPSFKLELTNPSIDAGIVASSTATKNITLGNRIWIDRNSDGLQNEDENDSWQELGDKGFEGTQVELYERTKDDLTRDFFKAINGDENAKNDSLEMYTYKGVTSTTKDGFYRFENLAEEKLYRVKFLVPERISKEYQFTKANVNDSSTHMNLEAAKQIIQPVLDKKATDEASKDESDADFMVKYFSMEKLHLVDGNTQEEKVNKVNELATKFYTALVPNALSDAANDSDVAFNGLSAAYIVNSARPSEQDINDGDSYGKQTAPNFDAGLVKDSVSIGNFVWYDEGNGNQRANGQFDQGEKPADGITAILYQKDQQGKIAPAKLVDVQANESGITDFSGQKIEPNEKGELVTTTDANGKYAFKGLKPNLTLLVKFIDQKEEDKNDKVIFTTHKQVNLPTQELSIVNNQIDSENYGLTDALTVSYVAESMKVDSLDEPRFDAGLVREVSLGNRVWFDKNANGRQDEGEDFSELQKAGLTIDVKAEKVKLVDEKSYSKTTTVDKTGHYSFEHLIPGEYTITFNVKGNENKVYRYTVANASNVDDKLDSDAIVTGNNANVALVKNVVVRNVITDDQDNPNHLTNPTVDAGLVTVGDFVDHHEYYVVTENGDKIPVTEKNHDGKRQTDDLTNPNDKYTTKKDDEKDGFKFVETKDPKNEPTYDKDGKETTGEYKPGVTQEITYVYEKPLVSLGDYTFVDHDKDGLQGPDDKPLANVTVTLRRADNQPFVHFDKQTAALQSVSELSTTTNEKGYYEFRNIEQADYIVTFDLSSVTSHKNYEFTQANKGTDDALDSDAVHEVQGSSTAKATDVIKLRKNAAKQPGSLDNPTIDAGVVAKKPKVSLGDYVWYDDNANGKQDNDEKPVKGVTVYLLDKDGNRVEGKDSVKTDETGHYKFTDLTPGEYAVEFELPKEIAEEYKFTVAHATTEEHDSDAGNDGKTDVKEVYQDNPNFDAGIVSKQVFSLGDRVWYDTNGNGLQDDGEKPVSQLTLKLLDENGQELTVAQAAFDGKAISTNHDIALTEGKVTTTTDAQGYYYFAGLKAGSYKVQFASKEGYEFTVKGQGSDTLDSNADTDGLTETIELSRQSNDNGENPFNLDDPTIDAGFYRPVSLGDYVWYDANANGKQDNGEEPVKGVTVYLLDKDGNRVEGKDSVKTDETGHYEFTDLTPGKYAVEFELPKEIAEKYKFTKAHQDQVDDTVDSDANENGKTDVKEVVVTGSTYLDNPNFDAGLVAKNPTEPENPGDNDKKVSLGDYVWYDDNANGKQDNGEEPVKGVTVYLLDKDGNRVEGTNPVTTDATGHYKFTGLMPGKYAVEFVLPEKLAKEYKFTKAHEDQVDDTADSDANEDGKTDVKEVVVTGSTYLDNPNFDAGLVAKKTPTEPENPGDKDKKVSLGDYVWYDDNANGIQDANESGVPNVTVIVKDANGEEVKRTITNADGAYRVDNLDNGKQYQVQFDKSTLPENYEFTQKNVGNNDAIDSDADKNGLTPLDTVNFNNDKGELPDNPNFDAGIVIKKPDAGAPLVSLGDYTFIDMDKNNLQSVGDLVLPNVKVTVKRIITRDGKQVEVAPTYLKDKQLITSELSTITDSTGHYSFTHLVPGQYRVHFELPVGYFFAQQGNGSKEAIDSDADQNGWTNVKDVQVQTVKVDGLDNPHFDAGVQFNRVIPPVENAVSLGDFVWFDENADGLQSPGEKGVANVVVRLLDENGQAIVHPTLGVPMITRTDTTGHYQFNNLKPGKYQVRFEAPSGYKFTTRNIGEDDAKDSDADTNGLTPLDDVQPGELVDGLNNPKFDAGLVGESTNPGTPTVPGTDEPNGGKDTPTPGTDKPNGGKDEPTPGTDKPNGGKDTPTPGTGKDTPTTQQSKTPNLVIQKSSVKSSKQDSKLPKAGTKEGNILLGITLLVSAGMVFGIRFIVRRIAKESK